MGGARICLWRITMKKYIVIGSVAVLVLVAVSVFALQGKSGQVAVAEEVAPLAAATSSSGCGGGPAASIVSGHSSSSAQNDRSM